MEKLRSSNKCLAHLPIDPRGYPIPWFVFQEDFRIVDSLKLKAAIEKKLCFVCGKPLNESMVFVIGPMCGVNRISGEPPCHAACAMESVKVCPFLRNPNAKRREAKLPENRKEMHELHNPRNPGVTLLWWTDEYELFVPHKGAQLIRIGEPLNVVWFKEGRPATKVEASVALNSGLPFLRNEAVELGPEAMLLLENQIDACRRLLPSP